MKLAKLKKYFLVFVSLIIVFSSCFVASAYVVDEGLENFGGFKVFDITIGLFDSSGNVVEIRSIDNVKGEQGEQSSRGVRFNITTVKNFTYGELLNFVVGFEVSNDSFLGGDYLVSGDYKIGFNNDEFLIWSSLNNDTTNKKPYCKKYNRTIPQSGGYQYNYSMDGSLSYIDTDYTEYAVSSFTQNKKGDIYNYYVTKLTLSAVKTGLNNFNIAFYDFNFSIYDPIEGKIDEVKTAISDSADEIKANDDQNMEELMHGWSDSNKMDTTDVDDFEGAQDALINDTSQGRNDLVNAFGNIGNSFIYRCLYSSTTIFKEFLGIGWLYSVIEFSLVLGIFAFLIGAVNLVVGRISSSEGNSKHRRDYNNSGKSKK